MRPFRVDGGLTRSFPRSGATMLSRLAGSVSQVSFFVVSSFATRSTTRPQDELALCRAFGAFEFISSDISYKLGTGTTVSRPTDLKKKREKRCRRKRTSKMEDSDNCEEMVDALTMFFAFAFSGRRAHNERQIEGLRGSVASCAHAWWSKLCGTRKIQRDEENTEATGRTRLNV